MRKVREGTYRGIDLDCHIESKIKLYDYKAVKELRNQFNKYGNMESIMKYITLKYLEMSFHSISEVITVDERIYLKEKAIGIDKMDKTNYLNNIDEYNNKLIEDIKNKEYEMNPIRMIYIKEEKIKDGKVKIKDRPISVHTVRDLVLQTAINNLIGNIIDKELLTDEVFGYREGIGVRDAIDRLEELIRLRGVKYALVLDIRSFFDTVNHKKLMEITKKYIKDKKVIGLIRKMITPHIMDTKKDEYYIKKVGISQGAPISPTLANIYLDEVWDKYYKNIKTKGNIYMIRYADDVMILGENYNDICKVKRKAVERFKEYDLEIAQDKTKIIRLEGNRIKYLGYEIEVVDGSIKKYIPKDKIDTKKMTIRRILRESLNDYMKEENRDRLLTWVKRLRYFGDCSVYLPQRLYCTQYIMEMNNMLWGMYRTYYECENYSELDRLTEYAKRTTRRYWLNQNNQKYEDLIEELIGKIRTRLDYMIERSNCN